MTVPQGQYSRKGPDILVRSLRWFVAAGWLLLLGMLILFDNARPITKNMFNHILGSDKVFRAEWNEQLTHIIFYCMIGGVILGAVGISINAMRHKRREDEYRWTLFFVLAVSICGIVLYVI